MIFCRRNVGGAETLFEYEIYSLGEKNCSLNKILVLLFFELAH